MAHHSSFFNSTLPSDKGEGASSFARSRAKLIKSGVVPYENMAALAVSAIPGGLTVALRDGDIFIKGYHGWVYDGGETLTLDAGSAQPRADLVVMRLDFTRDATGNSRAGSIYPTVVKGEPGGVAPEPARTNDVWEMALARVTVPAGAYTLDAATVVDTRGDPSLCGIAEPYGLHNADPAITLYDTPGTHTFTAPRSGVYDVEVVGGGGLYASLMWGSPYRIGGGGGGYARKLVYLRQGDEVAVTVGQPANNGINPNYQPNNSNWNAAGGASSFGAHVTAPGGNGLTGGAPVSGDLNIPGTNGGQGNTLSNGDAYVAGASYLGVAGQGHSVGYGAGSGYNHGMPGEPSGATGGCAIITWL